MVVLALSFNGDGADLPQVEHGISQVRRNHENELVFKISRICSHFVLSFDAKRLAGVKKWFLITQQKTKIADVVILA